MKKNYLLISFIIIVLGLSVVDIITADKTFSDIENRNLKGKVNFTVKGFIDGSFQSNYETYINDQFIARDTWIDLKSRSEYALGKIENNGIIYGKDGYLFDKFNSLDTSREIANLNAIEIFAENNKDKVSLMVVPNSYEIYKENLPLGAPVINQSEGIEEVYSTLKETNNISIINTLEENKDDYIYYKTDHHWTTYGAYLAYVEFIKSGGGKPVELNTLSATELKDFYGTYFSKAKPFNISGDTLTYYELKDTTMEIDNIEYDSLYDLSKTQLRDKYSLFLNGNNAITVIKNKDINNGKKLLVIKDSFANSLIPFLTENYEEIHVIDLRHYVQKLSEYTANNNFDDILLVYNYKNLVTDVNVIRLKY